MSLQPQRRLGRPPHGDPITQGKRETVTLRVAGEDFAGDVAAGLSGPETATQVQETQVGTQMQALLFGDDFVVAPLNTDPTQIRIPGRPMEWNWAVVALHRGPHQLSARLSLVISVGGGESRRHDLPLEFVDVQVRVDPIFVTKRIVAVHGSKLIPPAGVLGVITGAIRWWIGRRKKMGSVQGTG